MDSIRFELAVNDGCSCMVMVLVDADDILYASIQLILISVVLFINQFLFQLM